MLFTFVHTTLTGFLYLVLTVAQHAMAVRDMDELAAASAALKLAVMPDLAEGGFELEACPILAEGVGDDEDEDDDDIDNDDSDVSNGANASASASARGLTGRRRSRLDFTPGPLRAPLTRVANARFRRVSVSLSELLVDGVGGKDGDASASTAFAYPPAVVERVLSLGREEPPLRDEIYMQLMRQLRGGAGGRYEAAGWDLLGRALAEFAPSDALESYLEAFLYRNRAPALVKRLHAAVLNDMQRHGNNRGLATATTATAATAGAGAATLNGGATEGVKGKVEEWI